MEGENLEQYLVSQGQMSSSGQVQDQQTSQSAQPSSSLGPSRQQLARAIVDLQSEVQNLTQQLQSLVALQQSSSQQTAHVTALLTSMQQQSQPQQQAQQTSTGQQQAQQVTGIQAKGVKLEKPQVFGGKVDELMVWKFKVREYCELCGLVDPNDQAKFAVTLLVDKALVFWMDWSRTAAGNLNSLELDDLFDKLDEQFADVDRQRRLQYKFDTLVQRGTVQSYAAAHRHLVLQLGGWITDEIALYKFVEGLKPVIRKDVLLAQPVTVTDAVMAAERSEVANNFVSFKQLRPHTQNRVQNPPRNNYHPRQYGNPNAVPMELGYTPAVPSSSYTQSRPRTPFRRQQPSVERFCTHCGGRNHTVNNCFKLQNRQAQAPAQSRDLPPPPPPRRKYNQPKN